MIRVIQRKIVTLVFFFLFFSRLYSLLSFSAATGHIDIINLEALAITYRGPPLTRKSLTRFPLPWFLAYVHVSGRISVSRGPHFSMLCFQKQLTTLQPITLSYSVLDGRLSFSQTAIAGLEANCITLQHPSLLDCHNKQQYITP